ncbi:uncharacterized protein [Blastocystis hominis]|uniref:Uncharacterized protein n=1 Tax=Blastocystis hominis TaxID=12968 RepID=D8M1A2_BLAHO|nr:uncharacterized protein [Blastocystis hominis]CBK21841.2 unnamed protein product [Blastocystis hominis]|eukprot:XP_012895889.1 uncharacterized protein [Blastocystis hominis]
MVTEFFYPRCGGVEMHVFSISQALLKQGCHVIVITRGDEHHQGIEYFNKQLKVYYLPLEEMALGSIYPYCFLLIPFLRHILISEQIQVVHYHQYTSGMFHTSVREVELLGIRTVYTDHSLMNTNQLDGIAINKVLQCSCSNVNALICVSKADRSNLCERLEVSSIPHNLYVLPNGVNAKDFQHDFSNHPLSIRIRNQFGNGQYVTIAVLSRLVYRKGVFLLKELIDRVLSNYDSVNYVIAGGGKQECIIRERADYWNAVCKQTRVFLLGTIEHDLVAPFLVSCGDIFLSCSLTESFNITLLEAFVSGCKLVSTNVGGVPELFPSNCITLKSPTVNSLFEGIQEALVEIDFKHVAHPRVLDEVDKAILDSFEYNRPC